MATKEKKEIRLTKVLQDMSYSLNHIEDIMADDRQLLVKLVKQNNSIVEWLKQIEIEDVNIDEEFEIRIKVTDGNIVFPLSSIGHRVSVEGIFSQLNFSKEKAIQWKVHLAEEKGEILNPDSVIIEESDLIEYRINGLGAKIYPL